MATKVGCEPKTTENFLARSVFRFFHRNCHSVSVVFLLLWAVKQNRPKNLPGSRFFGSVCRGQPKKTIEKIVFRSRKTEKRPTSSVFGSQSWGYLVRVRHVHAYFEVYIYEYENTRSLRLIRVLVKCALCLVRPLYTPVYMYSTIISLQRQQFAFLEHEYYYK